MMEMSSFPPQSKNVAPTLAHMASCLRNKSKLSSDSTCSRPPRSVSFPEDETDLVTGYMEPANPWEYAHCDGTGELSSLYTQSCAKHSTTPIATVIAQIQSLDLSLERNACLSLVGEPLEAIQLEPLEEVLRRVQFKCVDVTNAGLDDESSIALFDMLEYYETANHLILSENKDIGSRGWHACSRMMKKTRCLERLDARGCVLNEQLMPVFSRALRIATQLQVLKLEACWLGGRSMVILAAALRLNTCIKELYLSDNELCVTDAIQLSSILRSNTTLQLLDVSNNNLQDAGVGHLSDGLTEQVPTVAGGGLGILVLWNNRLTRNCSKHFSRALALSKTLGMLNIGHNVLTNECLHAVKEALQQNRTLLRLGMQSTHLTSEGAVALAECLADHPVIQRIDLRDNGLEVAGLMALARAMRVNSSVTQMDIDDVPRKKLDACDGDQYRQLVSEIRSYCQRNEQSPREDVALVPTEPPEIRRTRLKSITSRKISLTCEMLARSTEPPPSHLLEAPRRTGGRLRSPAPSPTPSPTPSPLPSPSRQRFSVVKVTEDPAPVNTFFPSPSNSRFHVSIVKDAGSPGIVTNPSGCNMTVGFNLQVKSLPDICVSMQDGDKTDAEVSRIMGPDEQEDREKHTQLDSVSEETEPGVVPEETGRGAGDGSKAGSDRVEKVAGETGTVPEETGRGDVKAVEGETGLTNEVSANGTCQRSRKKVWIAPGPEEAMPSGLEKLIGLFHPGSFFSRSEQQSKPADEMLPSYCQPDVINNNNNSKVDVEVATHEPSSGREAAESDENLNVGRGDRHVADRGSDNAAVSKLAGDSGAAVVHVETELLTDMDLLQDVPS